MIEITQPVECPECVGPIEAFTERSSGITTHWCNNPFCKGRIADMLTFVADRKNLEIEGLGPEMAQFLAKGGFVVTLADLFEFSNDCIKALATYGEERFAAGMRKKGFAVANLLSMMTTIERAKTAKWDRWIACLGIPMIGHELGKVIAKTCKLGPESMSVLIRDLCILEVLQIEGLGPSKMAEIMRFALDPLAKELVIRLYNAGVRPTPLDQVVIAEGAPLAGVAFCITGEFYEIGSREHIKLQLEKLGAVSKSGVTKKVTHLLVGAEPGASKTAKARELKVPTYGEDWIRETFAKYGVATGAAGLEVDWDE